MTSVRRGGVTDALLSTTADAERAMDRLENIVNDVLDDVSILSFEELQEIATEIMELAQSKTPVDTGLLVSTAYTSDNGKDTVEVGYDKDGDAPYAIFVHEDLEATHEQGEAKFLERAIDETVPSIVQRIRTKLMEIFG
jgi:hypothetical protein